MRRKILSELEFVMLAAQYPEGHVRFTSISNEDRRFHAGCIPSGVVRAASVDVYFHDMPIYAPYRCGICHRRDLRVCSSQ